MAKGGFILNHIVSSLKLLPIGLFDLHEDYEPLRLEKTISSIENDQFLRHPILVTRLLNDRYLVLDGCIRIISWSFKKPVFVYTFPRINFTSI